MNRMSFSETIFLFLLALVIFGPKKLPEIARQVGKALNEFRRASNEFKAQIEQEISNLEVEEKKKAALPPASTPEGTASRMPTPAQSTVTSETAPVTPGEPTPAEVQAALTTEAPTSTDPSPSNGDAPQPQSVSEPVAASTAQESHA